MAELKLPPQDHLKQLLRYDAETGKLYWIERDPSAFKQAKYAIAWNRQYAGQEAFPGLNFQGYRQGRIDGQRFVAHRIIWKLIYGADPTEVDHINGDRSDNRLVNLREVSRIENQRNQRLAGNNTSGCPGVTWHKASHKWLAKIGIAFKIHHLGLFDTFDEAVAARKAAEHQYGFHENHGKAA